MKMRRIPALNEYREVFKPSARITPFSSENLLSTDWSILCLQSTNQSSVILVGRLRDQPNLFSPPQTLNDEWRLLALHTL